MGYFVHVGLKGKTPVVLERSGGIGDLICVLACVPGLKVRHPNSWFALITPRGCVELVKASQLCDAAVETKTRFHRFLRDVCPPRCYYVPLLPDERIPPQSQSRLHLAEEFAQVLGTPVDLNAIKFKVPERVRSDIINRLRTVNPEGRPIIVIHSGPTWPVREWPIERWLELVKKVAATDDLVIINVGTDFNSDNASVPPRPISNTINWVNVLDLIDLVALLEQANVFIGIDSGPLHIATIVGVPSIGLFGPTEGRLRAHPRVPVAIITSTAGCLGCHHRSTGVRHWRTGCPNDIVCMREIATDQVLSAARRALNGTRPRSTTL
jgi:ADP-heptose:LPS heptosyltransferase